MTGSRAPEEELPDLDDTPTVRIEDIARYVASVLESMPDVEALDNHADSGLDVLVTSQPSLNLPKGPPIDLDGEPERGVRISVIVLAVVAAAGVAVAAFTLAFLV